MILMSTWRDEFSINAVTFVTPWQMQNRKQPRNGNSWGHWGDETGGPKWGAMGINLGILGRLSPWEFGDLPGIKKYSDRFPGSHICLGFHLISLAAQHGTWQDGGTVSQKERKLIFQPSGVLFIRANMFYTSTFGESKKNSRHEYFSTRACPNLHDLGGGPKSWRSKKSGFLQIASPVGKWIRKRWALIAGSWEVDRLGRVFWDGCSGSRLVVVSYISETKR